MHNEIGAKRKSSRARHSQKQQKHNNKALSRKCAFPLRKRLFLISFWLGATNLCFDSRALLFGTRLLVTALQMTAGDCWG
jgi:hypothetical protein